MNKNRSDSVRWRVFGVILLIPLMASAEARDPTEPGPRAPQSTTEIRKEKSIFVPMRDGVRLSTDLYFPEGVAGKLPIVMIRTPYGKHRFSTTEGTVPLFVQQGYVVAIQDTRGRYESEGRYQSKNADRNDGYDTVDWLVDQRWSNGKVGTFGCSYSGDVQLVLGAAQHPSHAAMIPQASTASYNRGGRPFASFNGGAMELAETVGWFLDSGSKVFHGPPEWIDRQEWFQSEQSDFFSTGYRAPRGGMSREEIMAIYEALPVADAVRNAGMPHTDYEDYAPSTPESDYFDSLADLVWPDDAFDTPALYIDSWYDYGPGNVLKLFNQMRANAPSREARDNQFVIVAPSTHCNWGSATENTMVGERDLGDARKDFVDLYLRWFERWLKGVDNGVTDMPRVQYYLMGANEWRGAESWPVEGTVTQEWYLDSGGRANSRFGDGTLSRSMPTGDAPDSDAPDPSAADTYVYDPTTPVLGRGGQACCTGLEAAAGGYDQSAIEMRNDVLVYTSPPLDEGIEVAGFLQVVLYVSSDARDTDFTAKLVDVYPDGRAFNLQEGVLRMRYREDLRRPVWMEAGEVYEIRLDLEATANYFGEGHRIRLEVSSSNFPRWDRNLNTGGNNYDEVEGVPARNTVHHSAEYPSHVLLPAVVRPE